MSVKMSTVVFLVVCHVGLYVITNILGEHTASIGVTNRRPQSTNKLQIPTEEHCNRIHCNVK